MCHNWQVTHMFWIEMERAGLCFSAFPALIYAHYRREFCRGSYVQLAKPAGIPVLLAVLVFAETGFRIVYYSALF